MSVQDQVQPQQTAKLVTTALSEDKNGIVMTYQSNISQAQLLMQLSTLQKQQSIITERIVNTQSQLALFPATK